MSGGRGGTISQKVLERLREEALDAALTESAKAEINGILAGELAASTRDTATTRSHIDELRNALGDAVDDRVDILLGGSIAKHTYVDGLSDIDSLVLVGRDVAADAEPRELVKAFAETIRQRSTALDVADIKAGPMSVTVTFRDGTTVDLLPAFRIGNHAAIATPDGHRWLEIRPGRFARKLTSANAALNGRLVPLIKLAKSLVATLPDTRQVSGYHLESLAINAFEHYTGSMSYRDLLIHLFKDAAGRVRAPMRDTSGQSVHVDDELGPAESNERRLVSDSLGRLSRRLETATTPQQWRALLDRPEQ